jgi:hypothetical protein
MSRCRECGGEFGWDVHDDPLPEGETVFVRSCNVPGELGVENRHYCSAECLARAADTQPSASGSRATIR